VTADAVARHIEAAFADVPRPPNDLLLHPQSFDDSDIAALYEIDDWRSLPDDLAVSEYAALSFLSPDGFRHFIPAYMLWVLRHPGAADAVVDSTIWALSPESYADRRSATTPARSSPASTMRGGRRHRLPRGGRGRRPDRRRGCRASAGLLAQLLSSAAPPYDAPRSGTGLVPHPVFKTGRPS
jgi:hypothetical protein